MRKSLADKRMSGMSGKLGVDNICASEQHEHLTLKCPSCTSARAGVCDPGASTPGLKEASHTKKKGSYTIFSAGVCDLVVLHISVVAIGGFERHGKYGRRGQ